MGVSNSSTLISLSWPFSRKKQIILGILYSLCVISFLSLLEWNPWANHNSEIKDLPTVSEEMEWDKLIDVPWVEIPDIKYANITFDETPYLLQNCNSLDYGYHRTPWIKEPENLELDAVTSEGLNIKVFFGDSKDTHLSYPWKNPTKICEGKILNASVILEKEGDLYTVYSAGILGNEPRLLIPYDWVTWVIFGGISGYLLLKRIPTPTAAKNSKLRNQNLENYSYSNDDWVLYDSWELVVSNPKLKEYEDGSVIPEHPTMLHQAIGAIITPWIVIFTFTLMCLHLFLIDIFSLNALAFEQFMNNRMDGFDFTAFCLGIFIFTFGPWVLIGKLVHFKDSIMATFGAFIKKHRLQKLIHDVPTSTVRGMAVGRVEIAGVALSISKGQYKHHLAGKTDESIAGIKNPDNWPIFRLLARTKKETWDLDHNFEFILHDGTKGIKIKMPRRNFEFGEPTANVTNGVFYRHTHWSLDEGDPVFVVGEARIDENNEVYVGIDDKHGLPSVVFKGTEWTVLGRYRSYFEYIFADLLVLLFLIHLGLIIGGVI